MSDYFDRVERQLVRKVQAGVPHRSRFGVRFEYAALAASLIVVVAVLGVFLGVRGSGSTGTAADGRGISIVFSASPLNPGSPLGPSIQRSINTLRERYHSAFHGVKVSPSGYEVVAVVPNASRVSRARIVALAAPARFEFYDWEANALTPSGKTVASRLRAQDATALQISQGGSGGPGAPGAGSMPLYNAVKLASKQPAQVSADNAGKGSEYYMFGPPGSPACNAAAKFYGTTFMPRAHCILSGPDNNTPDLLSGLPPRVSASQGTQIVVPPGTVVLQATDPNAGQPTNFRSPNAQFYVLKDHVALSGDDITNPRPGTDSGGTPDVEFGFTSKGSRAFHTVTGTIARRGTTVSGLSQKLNQHFAVALDNKLITVPSIDFNTYPEGIPGNNGADITGGFTTRSAMDLATLLRFGPLGVNLVVR